MSKATTLDIMIMKNHLLKSLLPLFMDILIESLHRLARKDGNGVDDLVSGVVMADRQKITDDIKANL